MTSSLQLLFTAINQAKDEQNLRSQVALKIGEYFAAKRWGIFFFDQLPFADRNLQTLRVGLSVKHNPVVRYLVERHAPVHEALVVSPKVWTMICPRPDHWHVMAGPIVSDGQLIGVVGCTRERSMCAFDTQNLADLSAICMHLSVWAATVRQQCYKSDRLTPREWQITENSVKQALKRIFRKLEVSSRAQMVAQLFATKF